MKSNIKHLKIVMILIPVTALIMIISPYIIIAIVNIIKNTPNSNEIKLGKLLKDNDISNNFVIRNVTLNNEKNTINIMFKDVNGNATETTIKSLIEISNFLKNKNMIENDFYTYNYINISIKNASNLPIEAEIKIDKEKNYIELQIYNIMNLDNINFTSINEVYLNGAKIK